MLVRGNPKVVPAEVYHVTEAQLSEVVAWLAAKYPGQPRPTRSGLRLRLEDQRFYAAIWGKPLGSHVPSD
jgi:hypothetical protein